MLKQQTLGFNTEQDFIAAVQRSLKKEESERNQFDIAVLQAFADDYNSAVQYIARKWEFDHEDAREELPQEMWKKICQHINKWEFKGYKFATWLCRVASSAAGDWWRRQGIRLPYDLYQKVKTYKQTQETLWNQLKREPTDEELAKELNWSVEQVSRIAFTIKQIDIVSYDQPIGNDENDEESTREDLISTPSSSLDIEDKLIIRECIEQLGEMYRVVFILYYIEGYKQREIASMLGESQAAVESRIRRARNEFKQCVTDKCLISV